jgi:hypothetical protein
VEIPFTQEVSGPTESKQLLIAPTISIWAMLPDQDLCRRKFPFF